MPRACALLIALALASAIACRSKEPPQQTRQQLTLTPDKECQDPAIAECLADYAFEQLEPADIERLVSEGLNKCIPPDKLRQWVDPNIIFERPIGYNNGKCFPIRVGIDPRNDEIVEVNVVEDDPERSPSKGNLLVMYTGTRFKEDCCSRGAHPWQEDSHICVPPEMPPLHGKKVSTCELTPAEIARKCLGPPVTTVSVLSPDALRERAKQARACFAARGSPELRKQIGALPFTIALHEGDRLPIQMLFRCFDDCAKGGEQRGDVGVSIIRSDPYAMTEWDCCTIGEIPNYDYPASGFCVPHELATKEAIENSRCKQIDLNAPDPARNGPLPHGAHHIPVPTLQPQKKSR
jgi:hypothetical protein